MTIFKLCRAGEWTEAVRAGEYAGSAKDRADGFLHFSTASQIPGTLARYYAGADDLVLVAVDEAAFGSELKYELSRDGAPFPHLYAKLPLSAVKWTGQIRYDERRGHTLPREFSEAAT